MRLSELNLTGQVIDKASNNAKCLLTFIPAIELENYFFVNRIPTQLEVVLDAAKNKTNLAKVKEIQSDWESEISQGLVGTPIELSVVIEGKPSLLIDGKQATITYSKSKSFILGDTLILTALLTSLGLAAPLFSSKLSSIDIAKKNKFRKILAIKNIILSIIFDDELGINQEVIRDLFFKYNRHHSGVHLPQFSKANSDFPLREFVQKVSNELNLDDYGGVSTKSKHVKSTENYLTTEYILFKFLVGAVAGSYIQETSKMSEDVVTTSGIKLSKALDVRTVDLVKVFLMAWLQPLQNNNKHRTGFRLSAQIWQALSLVLHQLINDDATIEDVSKAGLILGQLDYSKKAAHWHDCEVMALDSNGRLYKNAASSTREFKIGLAKYFLHLVSKNLC